MALIAALILAAETLRNHAPSELVLLGAVLAVVALALWNLHAAFRTTPDNFPVYREMPSAPMEDPLTGYRKSKELRR